jgi:hypothetical protein
MKACRIALLFPLLAAPLVAHADGWSVETNEADPFDASKITFIAVNPNGSQYLWVRCLQGEVSLVLTTWAPNATVGDFVNMKLVVDGKPVRDEAGVVSTVGQQFTTVQFGNEWTLDYVEGSRKISVRYTIAGMTSTVSFFNGASLPKIITGARKACGLASDEIGAPAQNFPTRPLQDCSAIKPEDRTLTCALPAK